MQNLFKLNNKNVEILFCISTLLSCFIFNNSLLLILIWVLLLKDVLKNIITIFIIFYISAILILIDIKSFASLFFLLTTIVALATRFRNDILKVLLIQSIFITILISISLFISDQFVNTFQDVYTFKQRLYLVTPTGHILHPNAIGLWCSIAIFGFYINKRFILCIPATYILLLTQSRSAILFLVLCLLFSQKLNIKNLFLLILSLFSFYILILYTGIIDRFKNDGENGRIDRFNIYKPYLENDFITGIGVSKYHDLVDNYGTLDNLYFVSLLRFGIFGVFAFIFLFYFFYKNKKDDYSRIRLSIFASFMILGLIESSFLGNILSIFTLALAFNNFDSIKMKNNF